MPAPHHIPSVAVLPAVTAAKLPRLETIVFVVAFIALVLDAGGGPGWGAASARAAIAVRMDHFASAPLYDVLAGAAALLPCGEVGFRLGVLAALLGACTLAGVVAAVRALVPRDIAAALVGVLLLVIAPPFRDAAAFATPSLLAACGATWAFACAARHAREQNARDAAAAIACCAVVVGSTPWLGAIFTLAITAWVVRSGAREVVAGALGGLGVLAIVLWLDASGGLPGASGSLSLAVTTTGHGAAVILVGAGLLGAGFGALTNLPGARWLALLVAIAGVHEIVVGASGPVVLALLAVSVAIVPSAIVRAAQPKSSGPRRHAIAFGAGVPLVAIALAVGPTITVEDPGSTPAQLARDVAGSLPPGPGIFLTTRITTLLAMQYEASVAGLRPDLSIVPPMAPREADAVAANGLRNDLVVGADAASFGRLDVRFALPRNRGFELLGAAPNAPTPVDPPAKYATTIGHQQAILLALERARHEAASNRLDAAARALGLASRFGAADLAVLAATLASPERPALFGFLPLDADPPGDWMLDTFGDDLAWVGGVPIPAVDAHAPLARRLHAKWREIILGKAKPDDPEITAMGPRAVAATKDLLTALAK